MHYNFPNARVDGLHGLDIHVAVTSLMRLVHARTPPALSGAIIIFVIVYRNDAARKSQNNDT